MGINLGSGVINQIYLGSTDVKRAYLGSTLIHDKTGGGGGAVTKATAAAAIYSSTADESSGTSSAYTCAGGTNNCLVVALEVLNGSTSPVLIPANSTVTYNSVSMTYAGGIKNTDATKESVVHIFYLMNPSAGSHTCAWTTDQSCRSVTMQAVELAGVHASPIGQVATAEATSVAITPDENDSWVISAVAGRGNTTPVTPTGDTTELLEGNSGTAGFSDHTFMMGENDVGTAAALTMGATSSFTSPAVVAVEFKPA